MGQRRARPFSLCIEAPTRGRPHFLCFPSQYGRRIRFAIKKEYEGYEAGVKDGYDPEEPPPVQSLSDVSSSDRTNRRAKKREEGSESERSPSIFRPPTVAQNGQCDLQKHNHNSVTADRTAGTRGKTYRRVPACSEPSQEPCCNHQSFVVSESTDHVPNSIPHTAQKPNPFSSKDLGTWPEQKRRKSPGEDVD